MNQTTNTPVASPQKVKGKALNIFGLSQIMDNQSTAAIPSQWNRFVPHLGHIPNQIGSVAYGVIYHSGDSAKHEYMCGVEVSSFPAGPPEFSRLRIPAQTYAVFKHQGHISAISDTWKSIWEHALAASGYQASDGPAFERYGEDFDGRTGMGTVELWVPVKV